MLFAEPSPLPHGRFDGCRRRRIVGIFDNASNEHQHPASLRRMLIEIETVNDR
jgi:hypothetical protein